MSLQLVCIHHAILGKVYALPNKLPGMTWPPTAQFQQDQPRRNPLPDRARLACSSMSERRLAGIWDFHHRGTIGSEGWRS